MSKVSVESLKGATKEGWLTKQGGSIRTWKKRWFVLKDDKLYYFKTNKDPEMTGMIQVEPGAACKEESFEVRKKKFCFSLKPCTDAKRIYFIHAERVEDAKSWVATLNEVIRTKNGSTAPSSNPSANSHSNSREETSTSAVAAAPSPSSLPASSPSPSEKKIETTKTTTPGHSKTDGSPSARELVSTARDQVFFLKEDDSKVLEFWQIWFESIPSEDELGEGANLDFYVATSAKMEKLTWRTGGPQSLFIQKMVDFFWNVGAPETEIDRLNDVGTLINPVRIGSWIDMSARGGMDGGWFFPVNIPVSLALEAADPGEPVTKVSDWAEKHGVHQCFAVGRDMGAAPPRQTEIRVKLPGKDIEQQLRIAKDAYSMFGFPEPPDQALDLISQSSNSSLCLSVITSSEGFVRLGVLLSNPAPEAISIGCNLVTADKAVLAKFQKSLGVDSPSFIEFQYLKEGFGYGVYVEGFDVVFHFTVGEESPL